MRYNYKFSSDSAKAKRLSNVTHDQIAHYLLLNGKTQKSKQENKPDKRITRNIEKEENHLSRPFDEDDRKTAIETIQIRIAAD